MSERSRQLEWVPALAALGRDDKSERQLAFAALARIVPAVWPQAHSKNSRSRVEEPGAGSLRASRISAPHCGQVCVITGAFE